MSTGTVFTKQGDPNIYLTVNGRNYKYDPNQPPLGSGAMGTVYLGSDCMTGERIAVKRVKDQHSNNKNIRERAKQEASLAFHHPNLVEMVGCCETQPDSGPLFILSKYVQGMGIKSHIEANISKNDENRTQKICQLLFPLLDALSYIHSRGFIHRDIKPSNIMVENDGNVRLMDLGIARLNGGNKFSRVGFVGTPQYSAPEQILRESDDKSRLGPTTDLYALGITMYELLTGVNPFKSRTDVDTLSRQISMKLPDNNSIQWSLMQVMRKATEKDQSKRYQSADEMKVALRDALRKGTGIADIVRRYIPFIKM